MENKELFFDVKKVPLEEIGVKLEPKSGISHAIITDKEVLSFCSKDYALVTNKEIYQAFAKVLEESHIAFDFSYAAYQNSRFRMQFVIKELAREVAVGDLLAPEIKVYNSYDGHIKYQFGIGIQRLVCSNGLTVLESHKELKVLHTAGADNGQAVRKSLNLLEDFQEDFLENMEIFEDLNSFKVNPEKRVKEVIENTRFPQYLEEAILDRIQEEIQRYAYRPTDFLVYNAMNYQLQHNAGNLIGRKADQMDKEILEYILNY